MAGEVALAITAEAVSRKMGFTLFEQGVAQEVASGPTVAVAVGRIGCIIITRPRSR